MIIILILLFLAILFGSKIKVELNLQNKSLKLNLTILKVIKFNLKVKTNKNCNNKRKKQNINWKKVNIKSIMLILPDTLKKIQYLLSRTMLYIELKCRFFIIEPDKTALLFGIMNMLVYTLETVLADKFGKLSGKYNLYPDFDEKENEITVNAVVSIRCIYIFIFIIKMLPILIKYKRSIKNEGGEFNESSNRSINENYNG